MLTQYSCVVFSKKIKNIKQFRYRITRISFPTLYYKAQEWVYFIPNEMKYSL